MTTAKPLDEPRLRQLAEAAGCTAVETAAMCQTLAAGDKVQMPTRLRLQFDSVDRGLALRLIGRRGELHPRDVFATVTRNPPAADLAAVLNREVHGHEVAGRAPLDNGLLTVIDLRRTLAEHGIQPTDPALPDDWNPKSVEGGPDDRDSAGSC